MSHIILSLGSNDNEDDLIHQYICVIISNNINVYYLIYLYKIGLSKVMYLVKGFAGRQAGTVSAPLAREWWITLDDFTEIA